MLTNLDQLRIRKAQLYQVVAGRPAYCTHLTQMQLVIDSLVSMRSACSLTVADAN